MQSTSSSIGIVLGQVADAVLTVVILTPGIAMAISGAGEMLAQIGSVLAILTMAFFAYVVMKFGVGATA